MRANRGSVQGGVEGALTALLVLRPERVSRNRNFLLHASREAARARSRATALRGVLRDLTGGNGAVREIALERDGAEWALRYALPRVSARRTARMSDDELSIVRVALADSGVRLLPVSLLVTDADRVRVTALVEAPLAPS
jgi:hypothetical protein